MTNRGVSIAVSHVLTLGITTLLISGLLLGIGGLLDQQQRAATEGELRSIGDRISTDMVTITATEQATGTIRVRPRYADAVSGSYRVELTTDDASCFGGTDHDGCLRFRTGTQPVTAEVPVSVPDGITVEPGAAQSDTLGIVYDADDDTITITNT